MQTLLLTGSNGFLGSHFHHLLHSNYNIVGIYNTLQNNSILENYQVDITNTNDLSAIIKETQPNIIVHTAAISSIAACEKDVALSYATNVHASVQLAILAKKIKAQYVFCSTDLVFDGKKGNYTEEDVPNPLNEYASQKWIAEQKIITENRQAIIVRLPLMIGENKNGFAGVIADLRSHQKLQKEVQLFTNEYRTPIFVEDVVMGIKLLIDKRASGIFHIAGRQKLNRFEIAQIIKQKYEMNELKMVATTHQDKNITNRPEDVSLNIQKMMSVGFAPQLF